MINRIIWIFTNIFMCPCSDLMIYDIEDEIKYNDEN